MRNSVLEICISLGYLTSEKRSYPNGWILSKTFLTGETLGYPFLKYLSDSDTRLTGALDFLNE